MSDNEKGYGGHITRGDFSSTDMPIDGILFENCVFNDTVLMYSGGAFPGFVGCKFLGSSRFMFTGPAGQTLAFLKALYGTEFRPMVEATIDEITDGGQHGASNAG